MTKRHVFLAAIVVSAFLGCGPSYRLVLRPYRLEAKDFQLPSGLRVLFQEDHSQPVVFVTTVVDHGSSSDPVGKEGTAHLVEHLCFRARQGTGPTVWSAIEEAGAGDFNAFTTTDYTQYYTEGPKASLGTLLAIEAARMTHALEGVTEEILNVEREVVRNELRFRTETTKIRDQQLVMEMLFPKGHPYHRSVIGSHDTLLAITLADVRDFVRNYYVPANMTIVVAGDFDRAEAAMTLQRHFPRAALAGPNAPDGPFSMKPRMESRASRASEPPPPARRELRRVRGPVSAPTILLAWSLPGRTLKNEHLMEVTAGSLSSAIGMALRSSWRADQRKLDGDRLACGLVPGKHASIALCEIELVAGQDPAKIVGQALQGVGRMGNYHYSYGQADANINLIREAQSLHRAVGIATFLHYDNRADYFSESFKQISNIRSRDVAELAGKYLKPERAVQLIVDPYRADDVKPTLAFESGSSWAGATEEAADANLEWFSGLTDTQIVSIATVPAAADVRELTLENGLRVVLAKHGSTPMVKATLFTGGGGSQASPWGYPDFGLRSHHTGSPGEIAGDWSTRFFPDGQELSIEGSSGNMPAALDLLERRVSTTRSAWRRASFARILAAVRLTLERKEKEPEIWGQRALMKALLPGHPLAETYDFEAIKGVKSAAYKSWIDQTIAPANATLVVAGDISLDETETAVRKVWSRWRTKRPGSRLAPLPPGPADGTSRRIELVDRPGSTQSEITVACPIVTSSDESRAAIAVTGNMLKKTLWHDLRERAGATYGVEVLPVHFRGGVSYLKIKTSVQNDKSAVALESILETLRSVREGKVTASQVNRAKWNTSKLTYRTVDSTDAVIATIVQTIRDDRPLLSMQEYPARIGAVTAARVRDVLAPCIGHEVVSIVGAEKLVRTPLESTGIPVNLVDWSPR